MKLLGKILLACFVLAALRLGLMFIAAALVLGLVVALIRAPVQTLSVLFGIILLNAFAAYPALGLALFVLVVAERRHNKLP
jgi:hypothetical protein